MFFNVLLSMRGRVAPVAICLTVSLLAYKTQSLAQAKSPPPEAVLQTEAINSQVAAQSGQFLANQTFWPAADRLVASQTEGLFLVDREGQVLSHLPGAFGSIDHRVGASGLLVAGVDVDNQQALVVSLPPGQQRWTLPRYLPRTDFKIEGVCLYRDDARNEFVFLVGEDGMGEQWLVAQDERPVSQVLKVRALSLPPKSKYCQADDQGGLLYVNEENVGLWAYEAHPEASLIRYPVDMRKPFGAIAGEVAGMAVVEGGLLALDAQTPALHRYIRDGKNWIAQPALGLAHVSEPESISARAQDNEVDVLLGTDDGLRRARLAWQPPAASNPRPIPVIPALVQTALAPSLGDAADDPAIWVNPHDPARSRVLGTDKQSGLLVFDLDGQLLQELPVGRINNVDIRSGFKLGDELVDVAVATNRDHNSLHVFVIDRSSGHTRVLGELTTPLTEIYGFCMFKDAAGDIYAIANDKDGMFLQYRLGASGAKPLGELVRRFKLGSQPEGCVADDRQQRLYVGEEAVAVWALDARPDSPDTLTKVIGVGDVMHADIEGLAVYHGAKESYLVVSSQGNDSYVVLDAWEPYAVRGVFRVGLNAGLGIDGASETDGLEVTSADLGGPWADGMLVVQDGRKRMPEGNQNFKYVPWESISRTLGLE